MSFKAVELEEKWQGALARLEAAEAEMRTVERPTAGGAAEEEGRSRTSMTPGLGNIVRRCFG